MIKTPLTGHVNESTAYVVADYPYGFRLRTQIRYWLEHKPSKGYRFVSQTMNPKTDRWNKPKASTYVEWCASMYLDENDHVQWTGLGIYATDTEILAFVTSFPSADLSTVRALVPAKRGYLKGRIDGSIFMTLNGAKLPTSEVEIEQMRAELATWEEIEKALAA